MADKKEKKKDPLVEASKTTGSRSDKLLAIATGAKKKYKANVMQSAADIESLIVPRISTCLYGMDQVTNGGFPQGRIMMLYGEKSTAKTTTYLRALGNAQKLCSNCYQPGEFEEGVIELPNLKTGKKEKIETMVITGCECGDPDDYLTLYIDAEKAWEPTWSEKMGVLPGKVILMRPSYGEQAYDVAIAMVNSGVIDCVVIDSLAALVPSAEFTSSMEQSLQGVAARMNNRFLRKLGGGMNLCFQRDGKSPALWLVNQYREKIGVLFGDPRTLPGGKGQGFATSLEIECKTAKADIVKETKELLAAGFSYQVKKSKVGVSGGIGTYKMSMVDTDLLSVGDLMEHEEVIDRALAVGFIEKPSQTMYEYGGESFRGKGAMARYFMENSEEYEALKVKMLRLKLGLDLDSEED